MNLVIDGTHNGIQTGGPEAGAPWFVFDTDQQENVAGPFQFKWMAKFKLLQLNKDPK